jgi:hypothetical protein
LMGKAIFTTSLRPFQHQPAQFSRNVNPAHGREEVADNIERARALSKIKI